MTRMPGKTPAALAVLVAVALVGTVLLRLGLEAHRRGPFDLPVSSFEPRERVPGGALNPPPPRVAPEDEQIDPAALEAAARYAGERNSRALIVSRRRHIVFERYWQGSDFDTPVAVHSFGKTLAALLVGAALSERRIVSIDEPAARYIEEWRNDARSAITIRHLLQMTSGLGPPPAEPASPAVGPVGSALELAPVARPGTTWVYQDADPQVLGTLIERATGMRYAQYLSEKLWQPLEAGEAWLWLDRPGGAAQVSCCLVARQGDWMRVAEILLYDGVYQGEEVLPPGWVRRMLTPALGNRHYGFHVWLGSPHAATRSYSFGRHEVVHRMSEPYAADDVFFLDGQARNRLWLVPSLELAILRTGGEPPDDADWDDSYIPNVIIRGVRDRVTPQSGSREVDLSTLVPNH